MVTIEGQEFLTSVEAGKRLGCSKVSVLNYARAGRLRYIEVDARTWLIYASSVAALLAGGEPVKRPRGRKVAA